MRFSELASINIDNIEIPFDECARDDVDRRVGKGDKLAKSSVARRIGTPVVGVPDSGKWIASRMKVVTAVVRRVSTLLVRSGELGVV